MSKLFKCKECGSSQVGIMRNVATYNRVEIDEQGEIIYFEDEEPICEEYTAYVCGENGHYISLDGTIITAEKMLKEYLNKYGVEEDSSGATKNFEKVEDC